MGNCIRNLTKLENPFVILNKSKSPKTYKSVSKLPEEEKKHLNVDQVFEEIKDIKDLQTKGMMLISESTGKPKDFYDTLSNIAQCSLYSIKIII